MRDKRMAIGLWAIFLGAFAVTYLVLAPVPLGVESDSFWYTLLLVFFLACSTIVKANMVFGSTSMVGQLSQCDDLATLTGRGFGIDGSNS